MTLSTHLVATHAMSLKKQFVNNNITKSPIAFSNIQANFMNLLIDHVLAIYIIQTS
jgi:hypothetical protein